MAVTDFTSVDPDLRHTLTRHLDELRHNDECYELYRMIERAINRYGANGRVNGTWVAYLHAQLNAYARDPANYPSARIKARLIQQHVALYLPETVTVTSEWSAAETAAPSSPAPAGPTILAEPPPAVPLAGISAMDAPPTSAAPLATAGETPAPDDNLEPLEGDEAPDMVAPGDAAGSVGRAADGASPTQRLERFQALLQSEHEAWQTIYGTIEDFNKLKRLWMDSVDELTRERDALADRLRALETQVGDVETEREQLRAELVDLRRRAAQKALPRPPARASARATRRLSALPKRDLFVRQLEAEIERVKRFGNPLAVALINIDDMQSLTSQYGSAAGDAVRRCYAGEILASFRTYDLVARYDRDEFAVLFPNTVRDGAVRALEKAQKRAAETHFNHEGHTLSLPGFAGALALYAAGDEPMVLLERAGEALGMARQNHERLVVA